MKADVYAFRAETSENISSVATFLMESIITEAALCTFWAIFECFWPLVANHNKQHSLLTEGLMTRIPVDSSRFDCCEVALLIRRWAPQKLVTDDVINRVWSVDVDQLPGMLQSEVMGSYAQSEINIDRAQCFEVRLSTHQQSFKTFKSNH